MLNNDNWKLLKIVACFRNDQVVSTKRMRISVVGSSLYAFVHSFQQTGKDKGSSIPDPWVSGYSGEIGKRR